MELKQTIKNRYSARSYSKKTISKKIIDEIIKYANLAPSAGNLQARDFIIINDNNIKKQLCYAAQNQMFIIQAPISIVICANLKRSSPYNKRGIELYSIQDATAAVENILLLAVDSGLDTCWVGAFDEEKVSEILNLPTYARPIAIIPIGYADKKKTSTKRIDINLLTHYNQW